VSEKAEILKGLTSEFRKIKERGVNGRAEVPADDELPADEREAVRNELVAIADRLVKRYKFSIQECRRTLHEILDVAV